MRSVLPAFESSTDPASHACIGMLRSEPLAGGRATAVCRVRYWCAQRCVYPKDHGDYKEILETQRAQQRAKKSSNQPTQKESRTQVSDSLANSYIHILYLPIRKSPPTAHFAPQSAHASLM